MNSMMSWIFFAVFALILTGMYLAIRRRWLAPGLIAAIGVFGSILSMMLMSLAQGNVFLHAIIVGLLVGGLFSAAILAAAWYFSSGEMRGQRRAQADPDEAVAAQQPEEEYS